MGQNGVAMCAALWYCNGLDGVTEVAFWRTERNNACRELAGPWVDYVGCDDMLDSDRHGRVRIKSIKCVANTIYVGLPTLLAWSTSFLLATYLTYAGGGGDVWWWWQQQVVMMMADFLFGISS